MSDNKGGKGDGE
jgi:hypothetical protein